MGAEELGVYSKALSEECPCDADILAVFQRMSRAKREEFEEKVPPLGELIALIQREGKLQGWAAKRKEREEREARKEAEYAALVKAEREAGAGVTMAEIVAEVSARIAGRQASQEASASAKAGPTPSARRELTAEEQEAHERYLAAKAGFEYVPMGKAEVGA